MITFFKIKKLRLEVPPGNENYSCAMKHILYNKFHLKHHIEKNQFDAFIFIVS